MKDSLPLIGVVAGTILGWLLGQVGQWFVTRREEKKAIAGVLSELLDIRLRLLAIPKVLEFISQHFLIPPEAQTEIKLALSRFFPLDKDMSQRYSETVSLVAALNPLLGYRLRSQDMVSPWLNTLRQLSANDETTSAAVFAKLDEELLCTLRTHFEKLLKELAWMHGWPTWWKMRRLLLRPIDLPENVSEMLQRYIQQMPQGTQAPATQPAPVPDNKPTRDADQPAMKS